MDALTPKYKMPQDDAENKGKKFSAETLTRRLQNNKKKKQAASGMTSDDTKDDQGNSKLSTMRKVTGY